MELIPDICNDSATEILKHLDGPSTYYMSMVSQALHKILIPKTYIPTYKVPVKAGTGHILDILNYIRSGRIPSSTGTKDCLLSEILFNAATHGNAMLIKILLKHYPIGTYYLCWRWAITGAYSYKHKKLVRLLSKLCKEYITPIEHQHAIFSAAILMGNRHVIDAMLKQFDFTHSNVLFDIGCGCNMELITKYASRSFSYNILDGICCVGNLEVLNLALQNEVLNKYILNMPNIGFGGNIDILKRAPHYRHVLALECACERGHRDMVEYILINSKSDIYYALESAIRTACAYEYCDILRLLLGTIPRIINDQYYTSKHYADFIADLIGIQKYANRLLSLSILEDYQAKCKN